MEIRLCSGGTGRGLSDYSGTKVPEPHYRPSALPFLGLLLVRYLKEADFVPLYVHPRRANDLR